MSYLQPERYFSRISHINIERDLLACGFRYVLLDIDNTILSRATHDVPRDVGLWLAQARDAGIQFCLVSNNWHKNVHELANRLSMPIIAKAMKPLPVALFAACSMLGAKRSETGMIGDQLSTNVLAAHNAGMSAYLLAPLAEQDLRHTKYVRMVEQAILGGAVLPPLQAAIIDCKTLWGMPAVNLSFVLPLVCFVVITVYGHRMRREH